jgi:hypothetical protein
MSCLPENPVVRIASRILLIAAMACLVATPLFAQVTSGTIFGTVKDPSGAVVKGASVTIANPSNGVTRQVTTSDTGDFVAPNLLPGTYNVTVEAKGFKKDETTGIVLSAADKLNAGEFVLTMGATTESVTVTAEAGQIQLQSNSGERSDLITSKQLNDVAMNGRNVLDYMKLIPGVVSNFNGAVSGTGGLDAMNINGSRANQHEFTLDGASNVDTGNNGGTHVTLNPDAIEEVKVLTSNYQAEFGKAAGGQIAIVSKGGTNQWHGNGRFFHRHEGLNANEYFNKHNQLSGSTPTNNPPLYRYNDAGYQIGGPIKKDKLFVFWSQEFYKQLVPSSISTFYTPTDLERTGDFSQSVDPQGHPVVITGAGVAPGTNKIDRASLNSTQQPIFDAMVQLLSLFPEPNVSGYGSNGLNYNYSTNPSTTHPRREDVLRVDYQLNGSNRLFGRWIKNTDSQTATLPAGGFGVVSCTGAYSLNGTCTQNHPGWNVSLNLVSTIRPNLLNEFSVGPSVTKSKVSPNGNFLTRGANNFTTQLFYPLTPNDNIPDIQWWDDKNSQWNWNYLGATPWYQANTTINVNDNLSWIKKNHAIKFGMFYQRSRKDQIAWGNNNGEFQFGNGQTAPQNCPANTSCGSAFASMLEGDFNNFIQTNSRPTGFYRYNQLEFYAQDTWKVSSRLTLDYGMRFAWIPPQYDANNQIAIFNPTLYNPADAVTINPDGSINTEAGGNPLNGMTFTKNNTAPTGGWNSRGIMPEPRLGFAYDLFDNHKTILRGGFGMMHDRTQGNLIFNTVFENPATVQTPGVGGNNIANLPTLAAQAQQGLATQPLNNVYGASRDGHVPTVYNFSLGVQHEIASGTTLDLAYVGSQSRHLVTARDINSVPYGTEFTLAAQNPNSSNCAYDESGNLYELHLPPEYAAAGYSFSSACAYPTNYLVPYKGYGQLEYLQFNGTSNYNSLQASLQRRFSKGLTFGGVYTWSKSLTTASSDEDFTDPFNVRGLDYRGAGWDRTHVVAINYVYDLPGVTKHFGGPKWLAYVTDNFQLSGITQFASGTPLDTNIGWIPGNWLHGGKDWSKIQPFYWAIDGARNLILPKLGAPQRGTRDIIRTGGMQNWDTSLFKNIPLGSNERYSLQLRLEAFNVFNHTNFNNKNLGVSLTQPTWNGEGFTPMSIAKASNWGTYSDTYGGVGGPRVVQLGAKFYF